MVGRIFIHEDETANDFTIRISTPESRFTSISSFATNWKNCAKAFLIQQQHIKVEILVLIYLPVFLFFRPVV